jgi:hypothetical protein
LVDGIGEVLTDRVAVIQVDRPAAAAFGLEAVPNGQQTAEQKRFRFFGEHCRRFVTEPEPDAAGQIIAETVQQRHSRQGESSVVPGVVDPESRIER